jgi:hypothetical protein
MGPQNRHHGMHPDTMINGCQVLLDNIQDAMHCMATFSGTQEFITHKSCHKTYISDEQLHAMELCIKYFIKVQVEGVNGEHISQICRCTGSQSWHGGDGQNDRVWVKQCPGRCYGALNGLLPWQLQPLFKINLLHQDGTFVAYWSALAFTTIPENSGNLDPISKVVQVRKAQAPVASHVFNVGNIFGCAHFIPEIDTSSKTGDRRNE